MRPIKYRFALVAHGRWGSLCPGDVLATQRYVLKLPVERTADRSAKRGKEIVTHLGLNLGGLL